MNVLKVSYGIRWIIGMLLALRPALLPGYFGHVFRVKVNAQPLQWGMPLLIVTSCPCSMPVCCKGVELPIILPFPMRFTLFVTALHEVPPPAMLFHTCYPHCLTLAAAAALYFQPFPLLVGMFRPPVTGFLSDIAVPQPASPAKHALHVRKILPSFH